jgi:hypothetical protein
MPEIDVTEALIGVDIAAERFEVIRRQETVNTFGESTITNSYFRVLGSIQPLGEQGLLREEGQDAQAKSIKVICIFRLRGVSVDPMNKQYKPDIVVWNGNTYEVKNLEDYSSYGAGMIEAECTSINYIDNTPQPIPRY